MMSKLFQSNLKPEQTILRAKLDDISILLKKLVNVLSNAESDGALSIAEPQVLRRLSGLSNEFKSLKTLEEKEGEIFAQVLKNFADNIRNLDLVSEGCQESRYEEQFTKISKTLGSLEEQIKELSPFMIVIDEKRRKGSYEIFGGLLQKLLDAIEEKRFFLSHRART